MKTLIIPDIHEKPDIARSILAKESPDLTVYLGDFFDSFDSDTASKLLTIAFYKEVLADPKSVVLFGNHDIQYIPWHGNKHRCSGYSFETSKLIYDNKVDFEKVRLCYATDGYLLSHAGINPWYLSDNPTLAEIGDLENDALGALFSGNKHPLLYVGASRGGYAAVGGILWQDWEFEFETIPIPQIVGHTRSHIPRHRCDLNNQVSHCIDTELNHYAVLEDGKLDIRIVNETT